jgi:predicted RNA-binding protein associated with RNAse of E/G family
MSSPQTSLKKVFFGHEKKPFQLQHRMFRSNEPHSYYIDRTNPATTKQNQNAYHG